MTVVVGIIRGRTAVMAADSLVTDSGADAVHYLHQPKVWSRGGILWGVAGSLRGLQQLAWWHEQPRRPVDVPAEAWLPLVLVPAMQDHLGGDWDGDAMIAFRGALWVVSGDYCLLRVGTEWAIGSGAQAARGALEVLRGGTEARARRAVEAAAAVCASVGGDVSVIRARSK